MLTMSGTGSGCVNEDEGKVCRVCLSISANFSLFEPYLTFTPFDVVNLLTDIKIRMDDHLPSAICQPCLSELEIIVNFKRKCDQSDSFLRSNLITKPSDVILKTESVKKEINENEKIEPCCDDDMYSLSEFNSAVTVVPNKIVQESVSTKLFQCSDCHNIFNTKFKLKMHWKRFHEPKTYTCSRCKRVFKSSNSFKNHNLQNESCIKNLKNITIEGVGKDRIFHCVFCEYQSNLLERLKVHVVSHTGDKPFECLICQKSYSQRNGLTLHKQNKHPDSKCDSITCYVCAKTIRGQYKYATHLRRVHGKEQYQCDICKLFVKRKSSLICHFQKHANLRQYVCDICGESFNVSSDLSNHKKRRHESFTYSCSQCGYRARKKFTVQRHSLLHSNEKLSQCPQCYRFYECPLKLYKHIRVYHQKSTGELHHCPICSKGFSRKDNCVAHVKKIHHSDIKKINVSLVSTIKEIQK